MKNRTRTIAYPLTLIASLLRRLAGRRDGNVLVLFAMAAIPVIIGAGIAIDTARAYMVKTRLAAALDAAALAVGSQSSNATTTQLTTDLNNFFFDNYCKQVPGGASITSCQKTVATETAVSVSAVNAIDSSNVTYTATATVPTTFMRLVGVNNITVSIQAQTTKFPGMEVAVVLDNTGSMLCNGAATGASGYSPCGPVTSGTNACNSNTDTGGGANGLNPARICTLIPAAHQFVTTLENAFLSPQSIYMAIVPYVTSVNVGNALCTGPTSCSSIATTGGDFTDLRGNIAPTTPITGTTTSNSTSVTSAAVYSGQTSSYVSGSAAILAGMNVYGHGIPSGTMVSSVSGTTVTLSQAATLTYTANSLAVGPTSAGTSASSPFTDPTTYIGGKATLSSSSTTVNLTTGTTTNNIVAGMVITDSTTPTAIASGTTVATVVSATQITLSAKPSTTEGTAQSLVFSLAGSATSGSTTISSLKGTTTELNSIVVGMPISGTGIPANAYVTSTTGLPPTSLTISAATTSTKAGDIITLTNLGATTTATSPTVKNVSFSNLAGFTIPTVGQVIVGNGIPANTTVTAVTGTAAQFAAGAGQLTISQNATLPTNFSAATGTCCNTTVDAFSPITYDSTYNSASPAGSSTTTNWGGCVIEPTSSAENTNNSSTGVLNSATANADTSAPVSGMNWYPAYYVPDQTNSWGTVQAQDYNTETQANIGVYDTLSGPNQGCPVPLLPLTDLTTTAGQTAITNTINSMWPRDAGGTQVHVGMTWGWRVLDPNGPFAANNGHPLSYSAANSTGWKKIVVLMTDGTEEWPSSIDYTGLGNIADGKIGTTSTTTAVSNLDTRLHTLCTNMAAQGIIIYTIGLAADGQNNAILDTDCPANGGFYQAAGPPGGQSLTTVFNNIAAAIIHLRLTE